MKTDILALTSRWTALVLAAALAAQAGISAASAQALKPEDAFGPSASAQARKRHARKRPAKTPAAAPVQTKTVEAPKAGHYLQAVPVESAPAAQPKSTGGITFTTRRAAAIDLALAGDSRAAIQSLRAMVEEKEASEADRNAAYLTLGRVLYGAGDLTGSIDAYAKITRGSDVWFKGLEERGWANLKLDRPEEALSTVKTLMLPVFKDRVEAEPYFLASLIYLRVCDYKTIFKTIKTFKERFRPRIAEWEANESSDPEARAKLKDASDIIQKLSLVEAEAIQRVYMPDEIKGHSGPAQKITKGRDDLSFPESKSGKEVWLDEVDRIKVSAKGCPRPGTAGLASERATLSAAGGGRTK